MDVCVGIGFQGSYIIQVHVQPASPGSFPSLVIAANDLEARGPFAEAQAAYLRPDAKTVARLRELLVSKKLGVVAHFYMDPELQGVLAATESPNVHISDSLVMADRAVAMARSGVETIFVLGVDFMSENVRAMLDAAGFDHVPVYRLAEGPIGCSLAESAEALVYGAYLARASRTPRSLHVVYINTSLRTKARAHALVPTITCTSSNVVQTVLQAFAQVPDITVWFGPDTYMGENLQQLFSSLGEMDDAHIRAVHAEHDQRTIRELVTRFRHFEQGNCVVHHMFGREVTERVRADYPDAMVTAHLEVPGEMFRLALDAQQSGRGVVGSTSNILDFIVKKVSAAAQVNQPTTLQFVLGTEAGMITAIVRQVQAVLREQQENSGADIRAEIVFPVASGAIAQTSDRDLPIVPGVSGEGCSTAGGCATCPYMKMNSLDALLVLMERAGPGAQETLRAFEPRKYTDRVAGRDIAELGSEPILHMRHLQRTRRLSDALVDDIKTRNASGGDRTSSEERA